MGEEAAYPSANEKRARVPVFRSVSPTVSPGCRKAISCNRSVRVRTEKARVSKICASGRNVTRVPLPSAAPAVVSSISGSPQEYSW
ncbi:hypothetical protein OEIGOIKO_08037 [Streptomyces chrestomyceticus JCM 4735]|uniref:Uncharacterized protein n=1 Tax=Streptomyces chrestomyceticus JCM 4735 TaxID=1306181 RepID=A0A7U9Q366_9ACTN|nr:hypothetical protein [Streptomyces chrestomyceticus]GCD40180.1 hypothetical protein OEIGOIKO_08037 [Streptomyces chrestomyceticus JCM 4735]